MISANGKALIAQLLTEHRAKCERELALCGALLNGKADTKAKRAGIVKSANTIKKAGKHAGKQGGVYGPHNPHWTQTARGRKIQRRRALARIKDKGTF